MSKDILTEQSKQILQGIANGKTQREIAVEMGFAYSTIKNRITPILKKLKAKSSAHAVAIAIRKGWID